MYQIIFSILIFTSLVYLGPNQDKNFLYNNYNASFFSKIYKWWFAPKTQQAQPRKYEEPQNNPPTIIPKSTPPKIEKRTTNKIQKSNIAPNMIPNMPSTQKPMPQTPPMSPPIDELSSQIKNLERELNVIINDKLLIGFDHVQKLQNRIDDLKTAKVAQSKIDELQKLLDNIIARNNVPEISTSPEPIKTCENNPQPIFTYDITDLSQIYQITPPGTIFDNGAVVKPHSYLWIKNNAEVPIYAPVDMKLAAGSYGRDKEGDKPGYILFFDVSCEVEIKFDHIDRPVDSIIKVLPQTPTLKDSRTTPATEKIKFKAGDLIAHTKGTSEANNWDFGVFNTTIYPNPVTNGIPNLNEIDKRADCAYDYFTPEKHEAYKNLFKIQIGGSSKAIPYCQ